MVHQLKEIGRVGIKGSFKKKTFSMKQSRVSNAPIKMEYGTDHLPPKKEITELQKRCITLNQTKTQNVLSLNFSQTQLENYF